MSNSKISLSINRKQVSDNWNTLGMSDFLELFIKCGEFNISFHNDYISPLRGERATILYVNGKSVYLDFWEYQCPTYSEAVYRKNFDLIIKLQHKNMTEEQFVKTCHAKNVFSSHTDEEKLSFFRKIIPWTFFPSKMFSPYINEGKPLPNCPQETFGFFCGKGWRCRRGMKNHLRKNNIEYIDSDQGLRTKRPLENNEYIDKMLKSKYGIILHGRMSAFTEGKNRREIDYMFLKKPVLMNYNPFYYNAMENGKHFIFINEKTNLFEIENLYNINDIANDGHQWYLDNASPQGVIKSFKQIIDERL